METPWKSEKERRESSSREAFSGLLGELLDNRFPQDKRIYFQMVLESQMPSGVGFTVPALQNQIVPYLDALIKIQHIVDEILGRDPTPISILAIRYGSISVDLTLGIRETVELVLDYIIPWRRENKKQLAELTISEKEIEIKQKETELEQAKQILAQSGAEAENDTQRAQAEADRIAAETELLRTQAHKQKLENQKLQLELATLTMNMINSIAPDMSDDERLLYATKLLDPTRQLATSPLEIVSARSVMPFQQQEDE